MNFNTTIKMSLLLLASTLIGCNSEVQDVNSKTTNSTFDVETIEVVSFETIASDTSWPDLKDNAVVRLRTCLVDKVYRQSIVGEQFQVSSDLTSVKKTSSTRGCIEWTEEFNFNYLSDETFYNVNGSVSGTGNYKGTGLFSLAINPWNKKIIQNTKNVQRLTSISQRSNKLNAKDYIQASELQVAVLEKNHYQDSSQIKVEATLKPFFQRKGIDGGALQDKISGGEFNLEYFLISNDLTTDDKKILASQIITGEVRENGTIKSEINFVIDQGVSSQSKLEIGVRLTAVNALVDLGSFEATAEISRLSGAFTSSLIETNNSFSQIRMVQKQKKSTYDEVSNLGFVMGTMAVTKGSEGTVNYSSSNERSRWATIDIPVVDALTTVGIFRHTFRVEVIDSQNNKILFDDNVSTVAGTNKLSVRIEVPFKQFGKVKWNDYLVRVSSSRAPYNNIYKERIVHINPKSNLGDFGIDSALGVPPTITGDNTPQIHIGEFSYSSIGNADNSFKVNKKLDLQFTHSIKLEMQPTISVSHDYNGSESGPASLISGDYKVRFLLLAPKNPMDVDFVKEVDLNEFHVLTGDEVIATAKNGTLDPIVHLPLRFSDLAYYNLKNIALVEVTPLDEDVELNQGYFVGPMIGKLKQAVVKSMGTSRHHLSTGNLNIAKTLVKELKGIENKILPDSKIRDYESIFRKTFVTLTQTVNSFNAKDFSVQKKNVKNEVFLNEKDIASKNNFESSQSELRAFILNPQLNNISTELTKDLCHYFYNKNEEISQYNSTRKMGGGSFDSSYIKSSGDQYKKCLKNIVSHLKTKQLTHVKKITQQPYGVSVTTSDLSRSVAYFVSRGQTFSETQGVRETNFFQQGWNVHLGVEGPHGAIGGGYSVSGGTRTDVYSDQQKAEIVSNQKRLINQVGTKLDFDKFYIEFQAKVKSCIIIAGKYHEYEVPKKAIRAFDFSDNKVVVVTSDKQLYVCVEKQQVKEIAESWYFIKMVKNSSISDDSLAKNTVMDLKRGEGNFEVYRQTQIGSDKQNVFIEYKDKKDVTNKYKEYLDNKGKSIDYRDDLGKGFPGLIE